MKNIKTTIFAMTLLFGASSQMAFAQENENNQQTEAAQQKEKKHKKAWEFGFGGSVMQLNRMYLTNFVKQDDGYDFDLKMRHAVWGGDLYVARELNKHFYLDLTAGMGGAKVYNLDNEQKTKYYYTAGLGLQWRLSPLFKSKYIDPYFRVGAHYFHRQFTVDYSGLQGSNDDIMKWVMANVHNKDGQDGRNLMAIAAGFGVNMWFNNHVGLGMQVNYMHMPRFIKRQKNTADALQGSLRLIFRFGGESKKDAPKIIEVNRFIEKEIERIVEVERIVEREKKTFAMLHNVFFHFDTATFVDHSLPILDEVAEMLKEEDLQGRHFLIIGYTDSRGSDAYNIGLSRRRAAAVVKALEDRGVPTDMLKSRGVGKRTAAVPTKESHSLREGDRKVSIEEILIDEYWNFLPKKDH